ncbi:MAG: hypothetical protein R6W78_14875 [Bacteroidales bacterium]
MELLKLPHICIPCQLLIITFMVLPPGIIKAQEYKEKIVQDSIKISYRWQKDRKLEKDSTHLLMLQLENLSSTKVTVSFSVLFYWKAQLHSSSKIKEYCIKPGKKIRGKKWGLAFISRVFTLNDNFDPMFSWYVDGLEVRKNNSCNPRLKHKPEPAYP